MIDELLAAIAERMNRLEPVGVQWDRCVLLAEQGAIYGWITRDDGRSDFVVLQVVWGTTQDLDDASVDWLSVGVTTSSAEHSVTIAQLLYGPDNAHTDCQRVEHVFGALVRSKIETA